MVHVNIEQTSTPNKCHLLMKQTLNSVINIQLTQMHKGTNHMMMVQMIQLMIFQQRQHLFSIQNDIFGLHVVDSTGESYVDQNGADADMVPPHYVGYVMNDNTVDHLSYDSHSMCNTAIDDNYVLYDVKEYAYVYGSIGSITDDSFGINAVYSSMRTYPTKSNYTAIVTSAQFGEVAPKTQIQKCINVYLDTQKKVIAACNDVTSTWDWGVFGGSLAGICVVIGLWVWGGLYAKSFKQKNPPYYQDLVNYEAEWKRKDKELRDFKAQQKAAKKGMTVPKEASKVESNGSGDSGDSRDD
eukprot:gnl/Chilomastix_caulleri/334.p1 GENE.gnl/Chilomastix_caulleri/334~~gnl/Chilomastix_caulleri/334.p1  ORF type:complete len:298 (+),score=93.62 gnl/Chilomastix_caulleri/334:577-1470(+)